MENRLWKVLALAFGVGVVLSIPKVRKILKNSLARAGATTKEGYQSAVDRLKKERPKRAQAAKSVKQRSIKIGAIKKKTVKKSRPAAAPVSSARKASAGGSPEFEKSIIESLKGSPGGRTLADLGAKMGVHFIRLSAPIKKLVEQGRVSKKGNLYFAKA